MTHKFTMLIIHENAQCGSILNCELTYCMSKCCLIFIIGLEWQPPVMTVIFLGYWCRMKSPLQIHSIHRHSVFHWVNCCKGRNKGAGSWSLCILANLPLLALCLIHMSPPLTMSCHSVWPEPPLPCCCGVTQCHPDSNPALCGGSRMLWHLAIRRVVS